VVAAVIVALFPLAREDDGAMDVPAISVDATVVTEAVAGAMKAEATAASAKPLEQPPTTLVRMLTSALVDAHVCGEERGRADARIQTSVLPP
jgi:hypothetical protein